MMISGQEKESQRTQTCQRSQESNQNQSQATTQPLLIKLKVNFGPHLGLTFE